MPLPAQRAESRQQNNTPTRQPVPRLMPRRSHPRCFHVMGTQDRHAHEPVPPQSRPRSSCRLQVSAAGPGLGQAIGAQGPAGLAEMRSLHSWHFYDLLQNHVLQVAHCKRVLELTHQVESRLADLVAGLAIIAKPLVDATGAAPAF